MLEIAPKGRLSQGDIVAGLSARGYEELQTYGVIVTARCDLEHSKAHIINYIPLVPLNGWYQREGWRSIVTRSSHNARAALATELAKCFPEDTPSSHELEVRVASYGVDSLASWVTAEGGRPSDKLNSLVQKIQRNEQALRENSRPPIAKADLKSFLERIERNEVADLHHLPMTAIADAILPEPDTAHVALLRHFSGFPAEMLVDAPGTAGVAIRHGASMPVPTCLRPSMPFGRVARIQSPYIELFVQRATTLFSRVGVTDVRFKSIDSLVEAIL